MNNPLPTYKQGSLLAPVEPIKFGRSKLGCGQTVWVTTPEYKQIRDGTVGIARSGRNSAAAVMITLADAAKFFRLVA